MRSVLMVGLFVFALCHVAGCSDDTEASKTQNAPDVSNQQSTDTNRGTPPTDTQGSASTAQDSATPENTDTSKAPVIETGLSEKTLQHNGTTREYLMYVPKAYDGTSSVPLILNFHGFGGTASAHLQEADLRPIADSKNVILVYPQGTVSEGYTHWNTYPVGAGGKSTTDDIGFMQALIETLLSAHAIDPTRVYATGYSNGGDFTYTLACYLSDKIAAIAPVSALMWELNQTDCKASHPTAVLELHGTADGDRPYEGFAGYLLSVDATLSFWATHNKIDGAPEITTFDHKGTAIERHQYGTGDKGVTMRHYKVMGGQHVWFKFQEDGIDTNNIIWNFLSQFNTTGLR